MKVPGRTLFIILLAAALAVSAILLYRSKYTASEKDTKITQQNSTTSTFESRKEGNEMVLYTKEGTKTGLTVPYDWNQAYDVTVRIIPSPDRTQAVFNKWSRTEPRMVIFVSDIDGKNARYLAAQETTEGSGELDTNSLTWSADSKFIAYTERALICTGSCKNPSQATAVTTLYRINIATGEKTAEQL